MAKQPKISFQDLEVGKLEALLPKIQPLLEPADFQLLDRVICTLLMVLEWLQKKNMSLRRLRRMIFGPKTESSRNLLSKDTEKDPAAAADGQSSGTAGADPPAGKRKGHGRNGAEDYSGAERIFVPHQELQAGDPCPLCPEGGRLYVTRQPALFIRVVAQPIFRAAIYELMRLRCSRCGAVFTARAPAEAGPTKYNEDVPSMLAILCYGNGMPLTRIESLQRAFGVPLPAGTQWELLWAAAQLMMPVFNCLQEVAAQAWLFYHDDTHIKVLSLLKENEAQPAGSKERTGIFTTGIVAEVDGHRIALFFTGRKHAGENLEAVLEKRQEGLPAPIQMCDGHSSNKLKTAQTREANCCAHSRRKYVEVLEAFPEECRFVLECLKEVYKTDAQAKELKLSPEERLKLHQAHSQKPMDALEKWAREQIAQKKVEPNSDLGQAIGYMLKRWDKLTLFLREPGAPLDNNCSEQILKRAIRHRRNSLFYKTQRGALVGDLFMSLIETCRFCDAHPLDYLTALQKHARPVSEHPEQWLPWNYQAALAAANSS